MPLELRIGTRGSQLAMRQAELVGKSIRARFPSVSVALVAIETTGDRIRDVPIAEIGDKGVFVRALEAALLAREVDLAVHSLKDLPADTETPGLELVSYSKREDPRDVLISRTGDLLGELPAGARVGTSSLRRSVQLHHYRPDLLAAGIRGNVDTRLRKLDAGEYDAILLAAAGLIRLGLAERITEYFPVNVFVPDAGQGIIAVQARVGDRAAGLARAVGSRRSAIAAAAERAAVRALGADCRSPVGVHGVVRGGDLRVLGMAGTPDGSMLRRGEDHGGASEAAAVGERLGRALLSALAHRGRVYDRG